jgi:hypothetical protein
MPSYSSKSQKSSKSQSKNGGRRKKQTMRKLRRGRKSRKVMRGGTPLSDKLSGDAASTLLINYDLTPYSTVAVIKQKDKSYSGAIERKLKEIGIDINLPEYK